jgi:GxxExxY protein
MFNNSLEMNTQTELNENAISKICFEAALKVHRNLGPGLLESAYQECLFYELTTCGLLVQKEKALPLIYKEIKLECGYRIDIMVENKFVIEVKSVDALNDIHLAQVLTYLSCQDVNLVC